MVLVPRSQWNKDTTKQETTVSSSPVIPKKELVPQSEWKQSNQIQTNIEPVETPTKTLKYTDAINRVIDISKPNTKQNKTFLDVLGNFGKSIKSGTATGAVSSARGILGGVKDFLDLTNKRPLQNKINERILGKDYKQKLESQFQKDTDNLRYTLEGLQDNLKYDIIGEEDYDSLAVRMGQALGQGIFQLGASTVNPALGYVAVAGQAIDSGKEAQNTAYQTLKQQGASEKEAQTISRVNGIISGVVNMADVIIPGKVGNTIRTALTKPVTKLTTTTSSKFLPSLWRVGKTTLTEAGTEGLQDLAVGGTAKLTYDKDRQPFGEALNSFIISLPTALFFGGTQEGVNRSPINTFKKQKEEIIQKGVEAGLDEDTSKKFVDLVLVSNGLTPENVYQEQDRIDQEDIQNIANEIRSTQEQTKDKSNQIIPKTETVSEDIGTDMSIMQEATTKQITTKETNIDERLAPLMDKNGMITVYRASANFPDILPKETYVSTKPDNVRYYAESWYKGDPGDIKVESFKIPANKLKRGGTQYNWQLTEDFLWKKANEELPNTEPETVFQDTQKDVKQFESRVYKRMREENPELTDDITVNAVNLKEDIDRATKLIAEDKQKAYRIAMGIEESQEILSSTVNIALAERALEEGNLKLFSQLTKNRSFAQTRRGQEIVAEKSSITDNSVSRYVKELLSIRLENVGKKYLRDIKDNIKKISSKERALDTIDRKVKQAKAKITTLKQLDLQDAQRLIDSLSC